MKTRITEEKMARLFSTCRQFSEHLKKWEDDSLPDKYDHNCFEYSGQPSAEEFREAIAYQKNKGAGFIKIEGDEPLSDCFGLEGGITLTMMLEDHPVNWRTNPGLTFKTPSVDELETIEVKHYGEIYGEDFTRRNIRRLYDKYSYYGAYLDGKLVGSAYSFTDRENGLTCIDSLLVDEDYRKQYIATSLIANIKEECSGTKLFLHAEDDDTPKEMYLKMGFDTVDRLYEYISMDIEKLEQEK
ncbi:MAG: GNAT family N-acetyltransferase [Bacillota bacterium]